MNNRELAIEILKMFFILFFLAFHVVIFWMAIKHRHDLSGIVWAILFVGEQIHMTPEYLKGK